MLSPHLSEAGIPFDGERVDVTWELPFFLFPGDGEASPFDPADKGDLQGGFPSSLLFEIFEILRRYTRRTFLFVSSFYGNGLRIPPNEQVFLRSDLNEMSSPLSEPSYLLRNEGSEEDPPASSNTRRRPYSLRKKTPNRPAPLDWARETGVLFFFRNSHRRFTQVEISPSSPPPEKPPPYTPGEM